MAKSINLNNTNDFNRFINQRSINEQITDEYINNHLEYYGKYPTSTSIKKDIARLRRWLYPDQSLIDKANRARKTLDFIGYELYFETM